MFMVHERLLYGFSILMMLYVDCVAGSLQYYIMRLLRSDELDVD